MNSREWNERLTEAPASPSARLVLGIVLQNQRSGWCDLSRIEIAAIAGVSPETVKRAIWELVPDHLERHLIRGRPSMLKPASRVARDPTTRVAGDPRVGSSTKGGGRVARDPTHIGPIERGVSRVAHAADLDRLLRGTNVVPISRKNVVVDQATTRPAGGR